MVQSIESRVRSRVYGSKRGSAFTPIHFLDLGSRDAVGIALFRLAKNGVIRRLDRGLYDYPRKHPVLGLLAPDPNTVAKAIAGTNAIRIQPSGAYAANLLGLSTQVPAKITYLSDAPGKTVRVGKQQIQLKHTTPKNMATAGRVSGLVIQALRHMGKDHVDATMIAHRRRTLKTKDKKQLLKDLRYAPSWIADHMRAIAQDAK
jgi:Family of unknown function (DUF6088)